MPQKALGQHFLVESSIFERLSEYAQLSCDDIVLEVGAGLGFLTRFLAGRCRKVYAVEVDSKLVSLLGITLKDLKNVEIIKGDILKLPLPEFKKVISAPPYHISSDLIQWLFGKDFVYAVLIMQREFVNRLSARVGSDAYGWLTVLVYYHLGVEIFDDVPRWMFYPPPKVDSVIVRFTRKVPPPLIIKNEVFFKKLLRFLFTQRNRKVKNALSAFMKKENMSTNTSAVLNSVPFKDKRVRELAPEDFGVVANVLSNQESLL